MYCSSCGKELSGSRVRCPSCGRVSMAFWLRFYSAATLGLILAAGLVYFYKLFPIGLVGQINLTIMPRPFIRR